MPHPGPTDEPNVTRDDLRAALARGGARPARRLPHVPSEPSPPPAWDWRPDVGEQEAEELREEVARLEAELDRQAIRIRRAEHRASTLHDGLRALAGARAWSRRRVLADLKARTLL